VIFGAPGHEKASQDLGPKLRSRREILEEIGEPIGCPCW